MDTNIENKEIVKDTDKFPCPSCGGNMYFDPGSAMLKCGYCDSTIDFDKLEDEIQEYDFRKVDEEVEPVSDWAEGSMTIKCESCGAQTIITDQTMSKFCEFCGSSHIIDQKDMVGIAPESVVPFAVTKKQADSVLIKWLGKRWLAPRKLKTQNLREKFKGIYIPYWTYDSDTAYTYTAQAGDYYYVTESYRTSEGKMGTRQVRKIRWRFVSGASARYFDDIQVIGTSKVERGILKGVEPFRLSKLVPFQPQFLSGFSAERYSIDVKEGWSDAVGMITAALREDVRRQVMADEVRNVVLNINHRLIKYKHLLVPLWLTGYMYGGKRYQVMVNGESGKISGKAPVSPIKVALLILAALGIIALLYYLFMTGQDPTMI